MQTAFTDMSAETLSRDNDIGDPKVHRLYRLREAISYACQLNDDQFRFFKDIGLTHNVLEQHDDYIAYFLQNEDLTAPFHPDELSWLTSFVHKMGKAYHDLMAHTLSIENDKTMRDAASDNDSITPIKYAMEMSPLLNYLYAQASGQNFYQTKLTFEKV